MFTPGVATLNKRREFYELIPTNPCIKKNKYCDDHPGSPVVARMDRDWDPLPPPGPGDTVLILSKTTKNYVNFTAYQQYFWTLV